VIITSRAASLQGFALSGQLQKTTFADI